MNERAEMNDNIGASDGISFWMNLFTAHRLLFFSFQGLCSLSLC